MDAPLPWHFRALCILFGLLALALLLGGTWLLSLGGSPAYLQGGAWLAWTTWLLCRRRGANPCYGAFLLALAGWSIWEAGFDGWRLLPRLDLWLSLGLLLALPPLQRQLPGNPRGLYLGLAAVIGVALLALWPSATPAPLPARIAPGAPGDDPTAADWPAWGGNAQGQRYSPLRQIDRHNVVRLSLAWSHRSGDLPGPVDPQETTAENTPLEVDGQLYLCTAHSRVIALDAQSGHERWSYDPQLRGDPTRGFRDWPHMTCRGLAYHRDDNAHECPRRLLLPTADARLIALNADTGHPCAGFGEHGSVDLSRGLPGYRPGQYYSTSPPSVAGGLVVLGGQVTDRIASGVIRAYDVRDGHLAWNWDGGADTRPLPPGGQYRRGTPNMWSVMSVDAALGLLYLPMGNPRPDAWGGRRSAAAERHGSGVTALEIATGRPRWVFQSTHHDLWDMDAPAQPTLLDLRTADGPRPALLLPTKTGSLFVLDRRDGRPIHPVEERSAPRQELPGDRTFPTQPVSAIDFLPPPLRERDMWGVTPFDQLLCRIVFRSLSYLGPFTAPSPTGTLHYPGSSGIFNWGGVAVDPQRQVAFLNPSYLAFRSRMGPGEPGGAPYSVRAEPFLSALGLPCQAPPWGEVAAVDLGDARVLWRHRNGTVRDLAPLPLLFAPGVPSLGGAVVTASGVVFMAAAMDQYLRAYDLNSGRELWRARLPAGGQATPMTYLGRDGRQYLVISAGGHGSLGTHQGDWTLAFALPPQ